MNNEERKSLISFLSIYILSSTLFISIIAFMYYEKEVARIKEHSSISMSKAALEIKSDILQHYINKKSYKFKSNNKNLRYAILKDDKSEFFSNLKYKDDIDLNNKTYTSDIKSLYIIKLNIGLEYIIVEDTKSIDIIRQLKYKIISFFLIGLVIISFVGFILSKILLKPVKEKAEQLNRFVKDSSHELNTPITALMMIVPNLKKEYNIEQKTINQIIASTKYIKQTYDKLLFNINGDIIKHHDEVFDLKDIIKQNILFVNEIAKSKEIELNFDIQECKIFMDKFSASMVINNLISNAIKYTKKTKKIYIELKNHKLSVKDQGIGISKDKQKTVFTRYKRVTNQEGGFGIGLDIVSSVCKKYDIDITLRSKEKIGSTFILDFSKCKVDKI